MHRDNGSNEEPYRYKLRSVDIECRRASWRSGRAASRASARRRGSGSRGPAGARNDSCNDNAERAYYTDTDDYDTNDITNDTNNQYKH